MFAGCSGQTKISKTIFPAHKKSLTEIIPSRTNNLLSAVPPCIHRNCPVRLAGYCHIPGNWRIPSRWRILSIYHDMPLTSPSAVHLTVCFLPGSQQRGLSVKASLPLSPLQRFLLFRYFILYHRYMPFVKDIFSFRISFPFWLSFRLEGFSFLLNLALDILLRLLFTPVISPPFFFW